MQTDLSEETDDDGTTILVYRDTRQVETFRSVLTWRSHTLTWPPRQPDARIWLEEGWKAIHHGVRGWPDNVFTFFPVFRSVTWMLWFPCVEATFVLWHQNKKKLFHTHTYSPNHFPKCQWTTGKQSGINSECAVYNKINRNTVTVQKMVSDRLQPQTFYPIISQILPVLHYFMPRKVTWEPASIQCEKATFDILYNPMQHQTIY
jgi:hypothetical protein